MLQGSFLRNLNLQRIKTGVLSFAGTVAGEITGAATGAGASVLTVVASVTRWLEAARTKAGTLTLSGTLQRLNQAGRSFAASIGMAGAVTSTSGTLISVAGAFSSSGVLARQGSFFRTLNSILAPIQTPDETAGAYGELCMDMTLGV